MKHTCNDSDGKATPGEDFKLLSKQVTFQAGETRKEVSLVVYDDEWAETREEFIISLYPEDKLLLGKDALFYINDNDCEFDILLL